MASNPDIKFEAQDLAKIIPHFQGRSIVDIKALPAVTTGMVKNNRKARKARRATLEIRYTPIIIDKPRDLSSSDPDQVQLTLIDVQEVCTDLQSDKIHWMLITSHNVRTIDKALEIIDWYRKRWHIEQLFRSAKKGGMRLEQIELSRGDSIKKLAFMGLLASIKILQLTICRDGFISRPAKLIFDDLELKVLGAIQPKREGSTKKFTESSFCRNHRMGTLDYRTSRRMDG